MTRRDFHREMVRAQNEILRGRAEMLLVILILAVQLLAIVVMAWWAMRAMPL